MRTCIVCIAKNEDRTIDEWLNYHFKLGFDTIFMYQNDWVYKTDRENLVKLKCSGRGVQIRFYNHWLRKYATNYDWAAFIDCDEYISLHQHKNIKDFLGIEKFQKSKGISINWHIFGSCGQEKIDSNANSFLKRFTFRDKEVHRLVKVILNLKNIDPKTIFKTPHNTSETMMDTNGKKVVWPYNPNGPTDLVQINHYYYKSKQEWEEKIKRGNQYLKKNIQQWLDAVGKYNEIEDLRAMNFMYGD